MVMPYAAMAVLGLKIIVHFTSGPRQLRRSDILSQLVIQLWFPGTIVFFAPLAGKPATEMLHNKMLYSPSQPLLFLTGARGSGWGPPRLA